MSMLQERKDLYDKYFVTSGVFCYRFMSKVTDF